MTRNDYLNTLKTIPADSAICAECFGEYVNSELGSIHRTVKDLEVFALYRPYEAALDAHKLTDDDLADLEYASEQAGFYAGWRAAMAYTLAQMRATTKTA